MFRNMVTSLFKHDQIRTTDVKAKEIRRWADQLVTLAKRGDLHARRQAMAIIREKDVVHKLFAEAPQRFADVSGGYTRIVKIGFRPGDAAPVSLVQLVSPEAKKAKKPRRKKKDASAVETPQAPAAETPEVEVQAEAAADDAAPEAKSAEAPETAAATGAEAASAPQDGPETPLAEPEAGEKKEE